MEKIKKIINNKMFKRTMSILKVMVTILIIGFAIVVYLQRFSNNRISFFSYRMFTVVSGSMQPEYNVGDVIIAKEIAPSEIKVGDAISYLGEKGEFRNKVITHRVEKIEKNATGKYLFYTKGIANLVMDPVVYEHQIYGKIICKSVILSTIYVVLNNPVGFFICIVLPLMLIIGFEVFSIALKKEKQKREI